MASNISAKQVQNTALYPNKRASGEPFCTYEDSFVTLADMIAKSVRPTDVPNWAMVLKTAPASPWVAGEKTSVMIKFATVKITIRHDYLLAHFEVNCHLSLFPFSMERKPVEGLGNVSICLPSAERGPNRTAQKAQYHQDQCGSMTAISRGEPALRKVVKSTRWSARRR